MPPKHLYTLLHRTAGVINIILKSYSSYVWDELHSVVSQSCEPSYICIRNSYNLVQHMGVVQSKIKICRLKQILEYILLIVSRPTAKTRPCIPPAPSPHYCLMRARTSLQGLVSALLAALWWLRGLGESAVSHGILSSNHSFIQSEQTPTRSSTSCQQVVVMQEIQLYQYLYAVHFRDGCKWCSIAKINFLQPFLPGEIRGRCRSVVCTSTAYSRLMNEISKVGAHSRSCFYN